MRSILLVDDEEAILKALSKHVDWASMNIRIAGTAKDGIEAFEAYKTLRPDMLMTDVFMPGMDGIQLVQSIRGENAHIPIIILSGYEEFENARQAMRWGVNHFLTKPSSVSEIEAVVKEINQELDVIEQKQRLEEHYKREIGLMLPYLREKLFFEILTTRYSPGELPPERLEYLEIPRPQKVIAVSLRIARPSFASKLKERDWQLLKFGAGNIVREMIKEELAAYPSLSGHVLDYSDHLFVLPLLSGTADQEILYGAAEMIAQKTIEKIRIYLKIEASAGIGSVKNGLNELIDSYLESREALEALEFHDSSTVYQFRDYAEYQTAADHLAPLLHHWGEALAAKDWNKAGEIWQSIYDRMLGSPGISLTDIQTVCVTLFSSLTHYWNDQFPLIEPPRTMSQFLQEIQQHYTLKPLAMWMNGLVSEWMQCAAQELSGKKSNPLVSSVKQYVEQNYMREISFAAIAKDLFVHPKYLSALFKRVTGENFVTYLNRYRIGKAIEHLQSGQHMVYEVSEMVGFNNTTYFSQVCKLITGKSPSDFFKP